VPDAPQDDPFVPRYISLGDEILSNLPGRRRALIIQLELMTQRGEEVEALITKNRMPLRAMTLAVLSELKVEDVTRPDATQIVAERLRIALNNFLRPGNSGINAIDQVLVKRLFVQ
jgi:flagellar basal body-associated protein FliL